MADVKFRVEGLSALQRRLEELPKKLARNVMRGALRSGASVIAKEARALVPVKSGALKKSIKVRTKTKNNEMFATITAGDKKVFYAHMVENGTARHFILPKKKKGLSMFGIVRKKVEHPGAQPRPFMRPAFDSSHRAAVDRFAEYIRSRLPEIVK